MQNWKFHSIHLRTNHWWPQACCKDVSQFSQGLSWSWLVFNLRPNANEYKQTFPSFLIIGITDFGYIIATFKVYLLPGPRRPHPLQPHCCISTSHMLRGHPHQWNLDTQQWSLFVGHIHLWVLQNSCLMWVEHWIGCWIRHSHLNWNWTGNLKKNESSYYIEMMKKWYFVIINQYHILLL